jgi:hypothetical protein
MITLIKEAEAMVKGCHLQTKSIVHKFHIVKVPEYNGIDGYMFEVRTKY